VSITARPQSLHILIGELDEVTFRRVPVDESAELVRWSKSARVIAEVCSRRVDGIVEIAPSTLIANSLSKTLRPFNQ